MKLVIQRHGSTELNSAGLYMGATDAPLSEQGREEARAYGVFPQVERVYVSPMIRCRETASICYPNARQIVCEGLREMDFGDFEGRSGAEMYDDDPVYRAWVDGMCLAPCPNGESRDQFTRRVVAEVESIIASERLVGAQQVIIVAHGGTIMAVMDTMFSEPTDDPLRYYSWHVDPAQSITITPGDGFNG